MYRLSPRAYVESKNSANTLAAIIKIKQRTVPQSSTRSLVVSLGPPHVVSRGCGSSHMLRANTIA